MQRAEDILHETYAQTGKMPHEAVADAAADPAVYRDLTNGRVPERYVDQVKQMVVRGEAVVLEKNAEALNLEVDLNAPVRVVQITPQFAGKRFWELVKGAVPKQLKSLVGKYLNSQTGWEIELSGTGLRHNISSALKNQEYAEAHMEAVANLPELVEAAKLIKSHSDQKGQGLSAVHRMYVPMQYDGSVYTVKLTVKEYGGTRRPEIESVRKLYDSRIENKTPPGILPAAIPEGWWAGSTEGVSVMTIRQMLDGVKDSNGKPFFRLVPAPGPHSVRVEAPDKLQGELTEPDAAEAGSKLKGPVELDIYWDKSNSPEKAPE